MSHLFNFKYIYCLCALLYAFQNIKEYMQNFLIDFEGRIWRNVYLIVHVSLAIVLTKDQMYSLIYNAGHVFP